MSAIGQHSRHGRVWVVGLSLALAAASSCGDDGDGGGAIDGASRSDAAVRNGEADAASEGADGNIDSDGDSDGDGLSDSDEERDGSDPHQADTDGDGFSDGEERFLGTDPLMEDQGCADASASATQASRPVDIIVVVDNSSSMSGEIEAIIDRINIDFAGILADAAIDYQLILVSRHGPIGIDANSCDDHAICIEPPLAGAVCDPRAAPAMTERFKHYSVCIDSSDAFQKLARTFDRSPPDWADGGFIASHYFDGGDDLVPHGVAMDGWHEWLRPGAFRAFLMITDDDSNVEAARFEEWLYSKDAAHFGTAGKPNWIFHSIVGLAENEPANVPWPPEDPIVTEQCSSGSSGRGEDYQILSRKSGGLRFPICNNASFDVVFQTIATSVVEGAAVACSYAPSLAPGALDPDFDRIVVVYESGDGTRESLVRVPDAASCAGGDFYIVDERIELCPARCATVEMDEAAVLRTRVACRSICGDGVVDPGEECDDENLATGDGCNDLCERELI